VRAARTEDARRRRDTTPGFTRPGARLDAEGRWSLTPEVLALAVGRRAARALGPGATVLDAGCGAGGNAIGFARAGLRVVAVEQDAARLEMARHNAAIHGVTERIRFVRGDALATLARTDAALTFVDPPWGEAWDRVAVPLSALPLLGAALVARRAPLWAKLPPSAHADAPELTPEGWEAWFGAAPGDRQRIKFLLAGWGLPPYPMR
jgi:trimethylguanosine synthase